MVAIGKELGVRGFGPVQKQWLIRYVDNALVETSKSGCHLQVLRVIMGVLERHGWT